MSFKQFAMLQKAETGCVDKKLNLQLVFETSFWIRTQIVSLLTVKLYNIYIYTPSVPK